MPLLSLGTRRLTLVLGVLAAIAWVVFMTIIDPPYPWSDYERLELLAGALAFLAAPRLVALVIAWIADGYRASAPSGYTRTGGSGVTPMQTAPLVRSTVAGAPEHSRMQAALVCAGLVVLAIVFWAATALALGALGERRSGVIPWTLAILILTIVRLFWKSPLDLGQRAIAFVVIAGVTCPVAIAATLIAVQINLGFRTPASALVSALVAILLPVMPVYFLGRRFGLR